MRSIVAAALFLFPFASAQVAPAGAQPTVAISQQLVGTWSTSSRKVVTGPGFYDPVNDKFFEPELTGISYSFTSDGWYEEAYYRAVPNRECPPASPAPPRCADN